jgi:type II secretory pathway component PulF
VRAADLLFATADSWPTIELVIGGSLLALVLIFAVTFLPGGRPAREWILLHVPGIRQVYWSSVLARFTHTSALAAFSARPLPDLLRSAGAASGSCALARAADRASDRLTQGDSLADAAGREADIPALWTCVVSATAPRGELPSALSELARSYETRADQWVRMLRILLGPILLLLVAGFLATIVLAVGAVFSRITNAMMYF